ncbi:hypothetical protein MAPG_01955, partial [Magnaporthiopsis poae ATCC 64411]
PSSPSPSATASRPSSARFSTPSSSSATSPCSTAASPSSSCAAPSSPPRAYRPPSGSASVSESPGSGYRSCSPPWASPWPPPSSARFACPRRWTWCRRRLSPIRRLSRSRSRNGRGVVRTAQGRVRCEEEGQGYSYFLLSPFFSPHCLLS